jgi:hypothetical protein
VPEYLADYRGDDVDNSGCAQAIMEQPNPYSSVYWRPGNWPPARAGEGLPAASPHVHVSAGGQGLAGGQGPWLAPRKGG